MNIEINGVSLAVDFMDANFMEGFEPALKEVQRAITEGKTKQYESIAAGYRAINESIESFFNKVWGADTTNQIFNGSGNVMEHLNAVAALTTAANSARKEFNDVANKYAQRQNANGFNSINGHKSKQRH